MKLTIEGMIYGGAGLAHRTATGNEESTSQESFSVPFTLPGELVEAARIASPGVRSEATPLKILTPSPDRIKPSCAHFGQCGGCHYQHASYPAQIEIKSAILRETLHRAGLKALPEIRIHTGDPWQYRNRARLRVEPLDGKTKIGYNRRGTNDFLPIRECPISAPLILRAAEALLLIAQEPTSAGRWTQHIAEIEFFVTPDEKKLQMLIFLREDRTGLNLFCVRMQELIPQLTGAGTAQLPAASPQRRHQKPRALSHWGAAGLAYPAAGEDYWVSRGGFFQVNRFLLDELVSTVANGRRGDLAWDLYAGVGLFSRALAPIFSRVIAVEAAASDLVNTFKERGRVAVASTTLDFLERAVLQRERPQLIVVDPPRAGLGIEVCALLTRLATPEIVYVSCDPTTLAHDLSLLTTSTYSLAELHLFDLFPQTFHIETVAVLRKH